MGSIERQGLPPIGTRGVSISPEDARRFAVDLLDNYFSGPGAYSQTVLRNLHTAPT
ncbi:hypothetical protein MESS4_730004 [Mesorhizobium sp. STM 4661]|nr:hypothetical protein MESS4_730004 [Mesorhizobium sp. STM 4661]